MTIANCYTPYREGYFMSADDQDRAKADALFKFTKAKERLALLKHTAHEIAIELEGQAKVLKERPESIVFTDKDAEVMKGYKGLGGLVDDLKKSDAEMQRLAELMTEVGLGYMVDNKVG